MAEPLWKQAPIVEPAWKAAPAVEQPAPRDNFADLPPNIPTPEYGREMMGPPMGPQFGPPVAPPPTSLERAGTSLMTGVQGAAAGMGDLAGAPVDITHMLTNLLLAGADTAAEQFGGNVDFRFGQPPGGSQQIRDVSGAVASAAGIPVRDFENGTSDIETDPALRMGYQMNRLGSGALLSGAGLASNTAKTVAPRALTAPYNANVGRTLAGDTAAGAGSGAALHGYDEYVPEDWKETLGPIGELIAVLFGAAGGSAGLSTLESAGRGVGALGKGAADAGTMGAIGSKFEKDLPVNQKTGEPFKKSDVDVAAGIAQNQASNPALAARTIREKAADLGQDFNADALPTTGLSSDDVGLIAAENALRSSDSQVPFIERSQRTNTAARTAIDDIAPRADPRAPADRAVEVQAAREAQAQKGVNQAKGHADAVAMAQADEAAGLATRAGGKPAASETLDETVTSTMTAAQKKKNEAFRAIDPEGETVRSAAPLQRAADDIEAQANPITDGTTPKEVRNIRSMATFDEAGEMVDPGSITFKELNEARTGLADEMAKANKAGDVGRAKQLRELRSTINEEADRLAAEGGEAGERAQEALRIYKEEFAPVFARGPGDEAQKFRKDFNVDRANRTTTPPSKTAERFIKPGDKERAASLQRVLDSAGEGKDAGQKASRDFLLADMAEGGVLDAKASKIRPDALRKWRDKWGDTLDLAPGFRKEVDDMIAKARKGEDLSGQMQADLRNAEKNLSDVQKNQGALKLVIGKNPSNAVSAVFGSGDPEKAMDELLSTVGKNDKARQGLKAAVRDYIIENKTVSAIEKTVNGENPISFDKLDGLFKKHEKVLAKVYSAEEMNNLRQVHKLMAPSKNAGLRASVGSDTANKMNDAWRWAEIGFKAKFGILKGGGIMRTLKLWAETLPSNDEAVQQLVRQMWFDPELASHLLTRPLKEVGTDKYNKKLMRLLSVREAAAANTED